MQARDAAWHIEDLGGRVHWNPTMEILETIFRDKALSIITDVHFSHPTFSDEKWLVLKELPQPFGLHVEGVQFTDASLEYSKQVELLDYLALENTSVTDRGIAGFMEALPHVAVMYGYPGQRGFRRIPAKIPPVPLRKH